MFRGVVVTSENVGFLQNVSIGPHRLLADEQFEDGGCDAGPNPYELLLTALGACTAMTIQMYANRKQWPLEAIRVRLMHEKNHAEGCLTCETKNGLVERIEREILLRGNLTDEQREKLLEIADKCPVHRTLTSEIRIETRLLDSLLSERIITTLLSKTKAENDATAIPFANRRDEQAAKPDAIAVGDESLLGLAADPRMPVARQSARRANDPLREGVYSLPEKRSSENDSTGSQSCCSSKTGANPLPGGGN